MTTTPMFELLVKALENDKKYILKAKGYHKKRVFCLSFTHVVPRRCVVTPVFECLYLLLTLLFCCIYCFYHYYCSHVTKGRRCCRHSKSLIMLYLSPKQFTLVYANVHPWFMFFFLLFEQTSDRRKKINIFQHTNTLSHIHENEQIGNVSHLFVIDCKPLSKERKKFHIAKYINKRKAKNTRQAMNCKSLK